MLATRSHVKQINEARQADGEEEKLTKEDDEPQLFGEAKTAIHDVLDIKFYANTHNTLTLEERVAMLNDDQKRIFEKVTSHLLHQQSHETKQCECDLKPLHMFVSGVGGTGNSFLIEAIKAWVKSTWSLYGLTCAIAAPTGLAAFNVGGITIHRLFQLPIEHEGKQLLIDLYPNPHKKS